MWTDPEDYQPKTCRDNLCTNGATCKDVGPDLARDEQFTCECAPGFSGRYCDYPPRTCRDKFWPINCANGGTCKDIGPDPARDEQFICECTSGFSGRYCDVKGGNLNLFSFSSCKWNYTI